MNHLSENEKKKIYLHDEGEACGYLRHVFAYKKSGCLRAEKSKKKKQIKLFIVKEKVVVMFFISIQMMYSLLRTQLMMDDILEGTDIYIFDKDFRWTYVKTHETGYCGPYFS